MNKIEVDIYTTSNESRLGLHIPPSISGFSEDMAEFLARMVMKLDKNSHKETPTRDDMAMIVTKLRREVEEFEEQFAKDRTDENAGLELADIANFAFLAFVAWRATGRHQNLATHLHENLPEFVLPWHVTRSVRSAYTVERPSEPMPQRYVYKRGAFQFGPYLTAEDASKYGAAAYDMRTKNPDV